MNKPATDLRTRWDTEEFVGRPLEDREPEHEESSDEDSDSLHDSDFESHRVLVSHSIANSDQSQHADLQRQALRLQIQNNSHSDQIMFGSD